MLKKSQYFIFKQHVKNFSNDHPLFQFVTPITQFSIQRIGTLISALHESSYILLLPPINTILDYQSRNRSKYNKMTMITKKDVAGSARTNWNILFLGFFVLAATACIMSVLTGIAVVPNMHEGHDMSPEKIHSSFSNPGNLRKHNREHKAQFENAYHFPKEESKTKPKKKHKEKPKEHDVMIDPFKPMFEEKPAKYHMVFSTSCSPFQNWQSLAFFYFAHKVRQPGTVTRLVSGCTDEEAEELRTVHRERVVPLQIVGLQTFEMHVTPNFDDSKGGDQKYFNKPNGLLHWMQNSLGFDGKSDHEDDDSIIIIVDPDMMLIRPITDDLSTKNYLGGWVNNANTQMHDVKGDKLVDYEHDVVTHGRPHAQEYGYGENWIEAVQEHLEEIVGPDSPVHKITMKDAHDYYPAGPPYLATAKDMYQIAVHWVKFLPKYHKHFSGMMCEMHSYSLAAAHLQLPHKLAKGFMVSDVDSSENFDFIEQKMNKANVCMDPPNLTKHDGGRPFDATDSTTMTDPAYEKDKGIRIAELPFVLHFCQRYALGRFFFSKYKLPEDMFDNCEGPMMMEPPRNVAEVYDWSLFPNGVEKYDFAPDPTADEHKELTKKYAQLRHGWLLCAVVYGVNEAVQAYKTASCGTDEKFFQKTFHFHTEENFLESIQNPSHRPFADE